MIIVRIRSAARWGKPIRFSLSGFRARFTSTVFGTRPSSSSWDANRYRRVVLPKFLSYLAEFKSISNKLYAVCKMLLRKRQGMGMISSQSLQQ